MSTSFDPDAGTYYDLLVNILEYGSYDFIVRLSEETSHLSYVHEGRTMLSVAAQHSSDPRVVELLLRLRSTPDEPDEIGFTPLMYAVQSERLETVRVLLTAGVDVNYQSMHGLTALHVAVGNNAGPEIARMLLEAGADLRLKAVDGMSVYDAIMINPALANSKFVEEIRQKSSSR
jgi:ankyrin repeat protein